MLAEASYWITWFPGSVLATLGVLTLLYKGIVNVGTATKTLKDTRALLPKIQAEFSANSGSSMKDALNRLESRQEKVMEHQRVHDRKLERMDARVERIEDRLGA